MVAIIVATMVYRQRVVSQQSSAESAHLCIAFMVAHARTRDIAEAKDGANHGGLALSF